MQNEEFITAKKAILVFAGHLAVSDTVSSVHNAFGL